MRTSCQLLPLDRQLTHSPMSGMGLCLLPENKLSDLLVLKNLILKSQKHTLKAHHLWNIQTVPTPQGSLPLALSQVRWKARQDEPFTPSNSVNTTLCKV